MSKRSYTESDKKKALVVLERNEGNVSKTAKELKIPRTSLIAWRDGKNKPAKKVTKVSKKKDVSKEKDSTVSTPQEVLTLEPETQPPDQITVGQPLDNLKHEKFCQLYTSQEFFGNGVHSYIEAYQIDMSKQGAYKSACANASRLLTKDKIIQRIDDLIIDGGLNDQYVDKQLLFLITQHADFKSKLGAIKEYNALKARTAKNEDEGGTTTNYTQVNNYIGIK